MMYVSIIVADRRTMLGNTRSKNGNRMTGNDNRMTEHGYMILKGSSGIAEMDCALLKFHGFASPNPGECAGAAVCWGPNVRDDKGIVFEVGGYLEDGTSNQGEYIGLLLGLEAVFNKGYSQLLIEGDSNLIIEQTIGNLNVNSNSLKPFHTAIQEFLFSEQSPFTFVAIRYVESERNVRAKYLANEVLAKKKGFFRNKNKKK